MSMLPANLPTFVPDEAFTLQQWQAIEQSTGRRYEFHEGHLVSVEAMSGGSYQHALLAANLIRETGGAIIARASLHPGLGTCNVFSSNLRIAVDTASR